MSVRSGPPSAGIRSQPVSPIPQLRLRAKHSPANGEPWRRRVRSGIQSLQRTVIVRRRSALLIAIVLALVLGGDLLVFTVVDALWLTPTQVVAAARVVVISNLPAGSDDPIDSVKAPMLSDFRRLGVFEGVAGQLAAVGRMGDFRPRILFQRIGHPVETIAVTSGYFSVLGLTIEGRDFEPGDDQLSSEAVAIVSERLWKTALGGSAALLGTTFTTDRSPIRIIGVAPAAFHGARLGEAADLWIPRDLVPRVSGLPLGGAAWSSAGLDRLMPMIGIARLSPGVTSEAAERTIAKPGARFIVRPLAQVYGTPASSTVVIREGPLMSLLLVTSGLALVAGCATLFALILVQYERRRREFAIRSAIGASRGRLIGKLALELASIAAAGAIGAAVLAGLGVRALSGLVLLGGLEVGRLHLGIDSRVAGLDAIAALGSLIAAAAVPIARASRRNVIVLLATGGAEPPSALRLRRFVLAVHVAIALVVLIGALLCFRSLEYGFGRGPGFDVRRSMFINLQPSASEFFSPAEGPAQAGIVWRRAAAYNRLIESLRRVAGVVSVTRGEAPLEPGVAPSIPPRNLSVGSHVYQVSVLETQASSDYIATIGARLLAGRALAPSDGEAIGVLPAVMTASLTDLISPRSSILGVEVALGTSRYRVVGVVNDLVCYSLRAQPCGRIIAVSPGALHAGDAALALVLRTQGNAEAIAKRVMRAASDQFPDAARLDVRTGEMLVANDLGQQRLGLMFFAGFGLLALVLALGGVFGLVAYLAEARRRESGIRLAMGATHRRLMLHLVMDGFWPVLFGAVAGLLAAAGTAGVLRIVLVGVDSRDPSAYGLAAATMIGAGLVSAMSAAWRLRCISPAEALRLA